jgi:MoxR-like ATPase
LFLQDESRKVRVDESIVDYMIELVNCTREHPEIELGISPRGTVALFRATQSLAMLQGRSFVIPDDIKRLVHAVFEHRLVITRTGARARRNVQMILAEILEQTPVPA